MAEQCPEKVAVALTSLEYLCVYPKDHDGPHVIAISSDFNLVDIANAEPGYESGW